MSYAHVLTPAQANARMGWTPAKLHAYWNARAQRCRGFADEGACLARIARREPVTIVPAAGLGQIPGSVGQTAADIASVAAGLLANPDATLRRTGPAIVTALDAYVVGPLTQAAVQRSTPYIVAYFGPPVVAMYVMVALSTWFSYQAFVQLRERGLVKNRRARRGR